MSGADNNAVKESTMKSILKMDDYGRDDIPYRFQRRCNMDSAARPTWRHHNKVLEAYPARDRKPDEARARRVFKAICTGRTHAL